MGPIWVVLTLCIFIASAAFLKYQTTTEISYRYPSTPLGRHNIRLLRLLPDKYKTAAIRCQLFDYSLESTQKTHLYECLSYVWGDPDRTVPISINGRRFQVTENLHAALWHLRDCSIERVIWIDAICINQADNTEKEHQIQSMAKIYSQASRVVVWLGEAADNSDQAFQVLRSAARDSSAHLCDKHGEREAILKLFERPWFQRIWVLQEVAAARYILIKCGSIDIDGYAFCLALDSLANVYKDRPDLEALIGSVAYLIRGAISRPDYETSLSGGQSLDICPLSELVDMYHAHKASKRHDKVFALLGMSSDNLTEAGLLPNYGLPWEELLKKLIQFLLYKNVRVKTWGDKEMAVIQSKGCVLGQVTLRRNRASHNKQHVQINFVNTAGRLGNIRWWNAVWFLEKSARSIQDNDLICLLRGSSKPTIIRPYKDHFAIIMIAVTPGEVEDRDNGDIGWEGFLKSVRSFDRDFFLVWDWENPTGESQYKGDHELGTETNSQMSGYLGRNAESETESILDESTRTWNVGLILGDAGEFAEATGRLRVAIKGYEMALKEEHQHPVEMQHGLTPLTWAAANGFDALVDYLLTKDGIDMDLEDSQHGRTPLSWAAGTGHTKIVERLLRTQKVDINAKDTFEQRTPLAWAAGNGHTAVVKLLLELENVEVDTKDARFGRTPLSWAAGEGHTPVVKLLLQKGQLVDVDERDNVRGRTPLAWAAVHGYEEIAKLLIETGRVDVDVKDDDYERTPLSWAAGNGHVAIVRLLLETGKVNIKAKANATVFEFTPLEFAKHRKHEAVVELLQQRVKTF